MGRVRNQKRATKYIANVVKNRELDNEKKSRGLTLLKNDIEWNDEEEDKFNINAPKTRKQSETAKFHYDRILSVKGRYMNS
jgi:hypothetical protein